MATDVSKKYRVPSGWLRTKPCLLYPYVEILRGLSHFCLTNVEIVSNIFFHSAVNHKMSYEHLLSSQQNWYWSFI